MLATSTVQDVFTWYENNSDERTNTGWAAHERRRIRKLFAQWMTDKALATAAAHHLLEFINQRKLKSQWTRKRWNVTVQRPFNFAAKLGLISANPFRGLTFKQGKQGRDWTDKEYQLLLRNSPPCVRRFLIMIRFSGMRPGEIRGLQWRHVLAVPGMIVLDYHKTLYKTGKPRLVALNHVTSKLLAWIKRNTQQSYRHVFLNCLNKPWTIRAITKHVSDIRKRTGLPFDCRLHGGRHYFCTRAIMAGVDVALLAELVGHTDIATTQKYVHLADKSAHLIAGAEQAIKGKGGKP